MVVWISALIGSIGQSPLSEEELQLTFEGIKSSEYLTNQPDTVAELNINRSYDDLLDVSTIYLGPDLIQSNHVFNAEPSFFPSPLIATQMENC